jgi:hypothetical protein
MKKILFLIIIGTFISCSQDEYENSELNNLEFEPYFNSFLEEGLLRGYDFTNNNINFYFADVELNNTAGLCYGNDRIIIDRDWWNGANEKNKEWLIFHELGHCFLNRNHKNEKNINGECLSFMKGKENSFDCSENLYSTLWRDYYIDELFDENTTFPDWYTNNQEYTITYNNLSEIVSITNLNTDFYNTSIDFNNKEKFVIEFNFKNWETVSNNLNSVLTDIYFGGYFFGSSPLSEQNRIYISREFIGGYFENNDYQFTDNIKLTIRRNNELLQFFIDEQFIHAFEIESFDNNILKASFDVPINMDINVFEYN